MNYNKLLVFLWSGIFLGSILYAMPMILPKEPIDQTNNKQDVMDLDLTATSYEMVSELYTNSPKSAAAPAKWTFMVYLAADNNLEAAGVDDMNEMEMIGSTSDINIVVQMDRISGYDTSNGNWVDTKRFYIEKDSYQSSISSTGTSIGETNTGSASTLSGFISWSQTNYPAENYALILWDHGSGIMWGPYNGGVCWDDSSSSDYLTSTEIATAISGKGIDLLGFDACLMASSEFYYELRDHVSVFVGSEKTEPGDGWPYNTILSWLKDNPTATAAQLGSTIASKYLDSYSTSTGVTQSAVLASSLSSIQTATSDLVGTLSANIGMYKSALTAIRADMYAYDDEPYVDLYDFALRVNTSIAGATIKSKAQSLLNAISDGVIYSGYHTSALSRSHGLTVYFPESASDFSNNYKSIAWATGNWDEFLLSYYTSSATDDQFEENDFPYDATQVSANGYPGLVWSDDDWFKIEVEENKTLTVTLTYTHSSSANLNLYMYSDDVGADDGIGALTLRSSSTLATGSEVVSWNVTGGLRYVYIWVNNTQNGNLLSYSLWLNVPAIDDIKEDNDYWDEATDLGSNVYTSFENLAGLDLDWFRLQVTETALITVLVEYKAVNGILSLDVYGGENETSTPELIKSLGSADDNETYQFSSDDNLELNLFDGIRFEYYYFVVINYENNTRYNLTISVDTDADDTYDGGIGSDNDWFNTDWVLDTGNYPNLVCIDFDYYNISLTADQWVNVTLSFKNDEGDLDLYMYDSSGKRVAISYYWSDGEFIIFKAPSAANYTILVYAFEINLDYTLNVDKTQTFWNDTHDGKNQFTTQNATFPTMTMGTKYSNLTAWQDDYFKIYLTKGKTAVITLNYSNFDSTLILVLYNQNNLQDPIDYSFTTGTNEFIYYDVPTSGTYVIRIWVVQPVGLYDLYCFYDSEPTVQFTYNTTDPLTVVLQSNVVSTDGIENMYWDFGDGTIYQGSNTTVTHIYATSGIYEVNLYVYEYWDIYYYSAWADIQIFDTPPANFTIYLIEGPNTYGEFVIGWDIEDNAEIIYVYAEYEPISNLDDFEPIFEDDTGSSGVEITAPDVGVIYIVVTYNNPYGSSRSNMLTVNITEIAVKPNGDTNGDTNGQTDESNIPGYPFLGITIFMIIPIAIIFLSNQKKRMVL